VRINGPILPDFEGGKKKKKKPELPDFYNRFWQV
jgi:hypothetical protein